MKRIRPKVDREAVRRVLTKHLPAPHKIGYEMGQAADAILDLLTLPLDEEGLADAAYDGMQAGNNDGHGRGSFLACWTGCALAVLTAAGFVVDDE